MYIYLHYQILWKNLCEIKTPTVFVDEFLLKLGRYTWGAFFKGTEWGAEWPMQAWAGMCEMGVGQL